MYIGTVEKESENALFDLLAFAADMCYMEKSDGLGCSRSTEFSVELLDSQIKPVAHKLRYLPPVKQKFLDKELEKLLALGVIKKTVSDWNSAVVIVPKPGPGDDWRLCVDFRDVNACTRAIQYPIPLIDDILAALGGACKFVKLDLAKGFWQVPISRESQRYLTFVTRRGTFAYLRMPMGCKNSPAVFQSMMDHVLASQLFVACFVYIDDVVVFGKNDQEVISRTKQVLKLLQNDNLKIGGLKCYYLVDEVELLGRTIAKGRKYPQDDKLQGLRDLRPPVSVKEVRSLFGCLSYLREFVPRFAQKSKPISNLLKGTNTSIEWTDECQQALDTIRNDIYQGSLVLPQNGKLFIVQSDFSYEGLGAVLLQRVDGKERPLMFASRALVPAEQNYAPIEGEALAILFALRRFAHLLLGQEVLLRTDHRPLTFVQAGAANNRKLARWWAYLQEFNYNIEYLPGKVNLVPDCLSRLTSKVNELPEATLEYACSCSKCSVAFAADSETADELQDRKCVRCNAGFEDNGLQCAGCGGWFHELCAQGTAHDLVFWYCGSCLTLDARDPAMNVGVMMLLADYTVDDIIDTIGFAAFESAANAVEKYKVIDDRLYSITDEIIREIIRPVDRMNVLFQLHKVLGHVGVSKLYAVARGLYEWMYLYEDCVHTVRGCIGCQAEKGELKALPLKPVNKGRRPFEVWSIDYITHLPPTEEGFRYLLVMVDVFTKWTELVPMRTKESGEVADAIRVHLIARFGTPLALRSDRGLEFAGELSKLCQELGIRQFYISTRYPQANGQAERFVRAVKLSLTITLRTALLQKSQWIQCLPACLMALRFCKHRILGISPYMACFGIEPRIPVATGAPVDMTAWETEWDIPLDAILKFAVELSEQMQHLYVNIKDRILRGDQEYKRHFDRRHKFIEVFVAGDQVFMKTRLHGVFTTKLQGPFIFIRYKDKKGHVAELQREDGTVFDCAVPHLVAKEEAKPAGIIARRRLRNFRQRGR